MIDINKEEFVNYILQGRKERLKNLSEKISTLRIRLGGISQSDIWSTVKSNSDNNQIYKRGFLPVFDSLLETVLDNYLKSIDDDDNAEETKPILRPPGIKKKLRGELLNQPIAEMFNTYCLPTSIDLKSVENNNSFLDEEVPQYLESCEDQELFFNNLWKILEELNFADEEIGIAWKELVETTRT